MNLLVPAVGLALVLIEYFRFCDSVQAVYHLDSYSCDFPVNETVVDRSAANDQTDLSAADGQTDQSDRSAADGQTDQVDRMQEVLEKMEKTQQDLLVIIEPTLAMIAAQQNVNQVNQDKSNREDSNNDDSSREGSNRNNDNSSKSNNDYSRVWKWLGDRVFSGLTNTVAERALRAITPYARVNVEQSCNVAVNVVGIEAPEACRIVAETLSPANSKSDRSECNSHAETL